MVLSSWSRCCGLIVVAIVIAAVVSVVVSVAFVVAVVINCCRHCCLHCCWWTEAIVEYYGIVSYSVFVYQIDSQCSFLCRPHTDRFPEGVPKILWRNRNHDSCEKNATGMEKTGIQRIPAGIGNLASS